MGFEEKNHKNKTNHCFLVGVVDVLSDSPWLAACPAFIGSLMTRTHTVLDLDCFPYASGDVRSKSLNL